LNEVKHDLIKDLNILRRKVGKKLVDNRPLLSILFVCPKGDYFL